MIREPMIRDYLEEFLKEKKNTLLSLFPCEKWEDIEGSFRHDFSYSQISEYCAYSDKHAHEELEFFAHTFVAQVCGDTLDAAKFAWETAQPLTTSFKRFGG